ncbi:uncharacterized protein LOC131033033 [Cryptomeria japonica]|uniref:uncharacterized protein LOC131033033 n=1 Tax=Cryptomeria japonica TaxID=3369 RepID=UPI0027DA2B6D|nr:uncharacterized protein LOC131033033 [Cryptomeria japonica]
MSVYEVLESFNFPKGILPANAKGYVLHPNGSFQAFLDGVCNMKVEGLGYQIRYEKKIMGNISAGSLRNLKGVRVKVSFLWLPVSAVKVSDGKLTFYVGPFSLTFDASSFDEIPECE